jgi:protein-disulfide isomerase
MTIIPFAIRRLYCRLLRQLTIDNIASLGVYFMEDKSKSKGKEDAGKSGVGRTRTIERRKERQREQRRQRQIIAAVVVGVIAVIFVGLIIISNLPAEAPIPETAQSKYEGLEVGTSLQGYPRLGSASAPVQIVEFSSFDCPHCEEFHRNVLPGLLERVRAGDASFTFVTVYGTGGITNGEGAAKAAMCAAEQGGFFPFHDALFDWQTRYANQAFTQARMGTGISNLGMDRGAFDACLRNGTYDALVLSPTETQQIAPDFTGTPFVQVNGAAVVADLAAINQAIDQGLALAGVTPGNAQSPDATAEATAEATTEATSEATTEATSEATAESTTAAETTPVSEATAEPTSEATP